MPSVARDVAEGPGMLGAIGSHLRRRAENVSVIILVTMFCALLTQVAFRYFINMPMGWTDELSLIMWIWLVLWGAAFVVREVDEIRFDLILASVPSPARRGLTVISAAALVLLFMISLPAVIDYIAFMRVQRTAYFHLRFDWLFSIYILFAVAAIIRYLWIGWRAVLARGSVLETEEPVSGR
jgi:TRAP-type C4-dicarboxylate transport system permease small subunit